MSKLTLEWGYNWDAFTASTIHLSGPGYDLTLRDVAAHDRPGIYQAVDLVNTVAQYNARIGYAIDDKWTVSLGIDHMKYVALNGQTVSMDGWIAPGHPHAGVYNNTPMRIGMAGDIVNNFEHTNGLNLVDVEFAYSHALAQSGPFRLSLRVGAGAGVVIPKTDVTIFGERLDNVFHVAGVGVSASVGFRAELFGYFFVDARVKGGGIALPDVLTLSGGKASHAFGFVEPMITAGVAIPLGGSK